MARRDAEKGSRSVVHVRSRGCNQVLGAVHAVSVGDRVREFCLNIPEVVAEFDRIADARSKPTVAECV